MAATVYGPSFQSLFNGEIDFDTDTIKAALATSAYTPDFGTHRYFSSVTNQVTGTGYTAGGVALASKTVTFTVANSWATSRANSTAYTLGQIVRPATGNGFLYQVVAAGTSAASIPTYPTVIGATVVDSGVTWSCVGRGIFQLDAADPAWTTSTITGRVVIIYKDTGTAATSPLICADVLPADVSSTAATWTYQVDALGLLYAFH
jgi:hypothetical protein